MARDCIPDILGDADSSAQCLEGVTKPVRGICRTRQLDCLAKVLSPALAEVRTEIPTRTWSELGKQLPARVEGPDVLKKSQTF